MVILLAIAHPPFENVLVFCKERAIFERSKRMAPKGILTPFGAFTLGLSGESIS